MMKAYVITTRMCTHGTGDQPVKMLVECDCGRRDEFDLEKDKPCPYRMVVKCTSCNDRVKFRVNCCVTIAWGQENQLEVVP